MFGAVFGDKYTRDDYGAIMNYARIIPPAPKTNYVNIAGGNSSLDLTEALGGIAYEDGSIEFKFTLFSQEALARMKNDIHGRHMDIILEREPDFCYNGRISCTKEAQDGRLYELCLTAQVYPYKFERMEVIHTETVDGKEKEILLQNDTMPVMPTIVVEGNVCATHEGTKYRMETGEYQDPDFILHEGDNRIKISGKGSIKLAYRRGRII